MRVQESEEPYGLAQYRDIATRRRWWILGTLFAVWAAAWISAWMLPYRPERQRIWSAIAPLTRILRPQPLPAVTNTARTAH